MSDRGSEVSEWGGWRFAKLASLSTGLAWPETNPPPPLRSPTSHKLASLARRTSQTPKTPFHEYHKDNEVPFPQVLGVLCFNTSGVKLTNGLGAAAPAPNAEFDCDSSDSESDSDGSDSEPEKKKMKV